MASEFHVLASQLVSRLSEVHELKLAALRKENAELRSELFEAKRNARDVEFRESKHDAPGIPLKTVISSASLQNTSLSPEPCAPSSSSVSASEGDRHHRFPTVSHGIESIAKLWWRRSDRCLVYPHDKMVHRWDGVVTSALIITGFFTPFEVAFLEVKMDLVMVLNVIMWAIFVSDMCLQCFLVRKRRGSNGLENITNHSELCCLYLRSWFVVDLVSVLPFGIVAAATGSSRMNKLKAFRVIRVLRLLKLLRVVRASRIISRWAAAISLPQSIIGYLKVAMILIMGVHWMGCFWGLIGRELAFYDSYSWIDALADGKPEGMSLSAERPAAWNVYIAGCHYAAMTITSIGYGDIGPQQTSEYICGILFQCIGGMLWAVVLGTFCSVLATADPGMIRHRQTMDELNYMMSAQNFDLPTQRELRLFFIDAHARHETEQQKRLLMQMSPLLRARVAAMIHGRLIRSVRYIRQASNDFVASVALCMRCAVYIQGEKMLDCIDKLSVLNRGVVVRAGAVKRRGSSWGEDFVLAKQLQYHVASLALTFVEIVCLTASDFAEATMSATAEDHELIRKGILRLKFCRVLVFNARSAHKAHTRCALTKRTRGDTWLGMISVNRLGDSKLPSLFDPSAHSISMARV